VMEKEWQPAVTPARVKATPAPVLPPEPPEPFVEDELIRRAREELGAEVRIG